MTFIKKIKISEKAFACIAIMALLALLAPLLRLGLYSAPYYDDYGYGQPVKYIVADGGNIADVISGIIGNVKVTWYAWQGTYSSVAMMSVMPAVFGEQYYFIGSWLIIGCISLAVFAFAYKLAAVFLKANFWQRIGTAALCVIFLIELVYTAHQGFYWYNGGVHYVFMYGMMLFMLVACINVLYCKNKALTIVAEVLLSILAIIVAGANFVVALQGILLVIMFGVIAAVAKNKRGFYLTLPLGLYVFGLRMNLLAPGNSVRSSYYTGYTAVKSIVYSFKYAVLYISEFTGFITIVIMAAMAPILWNMVISSSPDGKFKLPGVVSLLSFCFYATGFTPSLYGMANPGLERTLNVVKFTYQLLLIINEAYWLGWLADKRKSKGKKAEAISYNLLYYAGCFILVVICFVTSNNQAGSFSSYGAYYYVHTGEAANYRNEYLTTVEAIEKSDGGDVVVKQHMFRPWLLCGNNELSEDPNAEQNAMMAKFYRVKTIRSESLQ